MKKFEDKFNENISLIKTALGDVCSVTLVKAVFKNWISPEDHQNTVASNKAYEKSNRTLSEENAKFVVENIELQKQIAELKSQIEKQQPEIPQFVAEYARDCERELSDVLDEIYMETDYLEDHSTRSEREGLIARYWLYNRTVAKEKRFYLKAKELLVVGEYDHVEDLWLDLNKNYTPKKSMAHKFTQKEIDSMAADSYEKIEVEE